MIPRMALYAVWRRLYGGIPPAERPVIAEGHIKSLERRMRFLGSLRQSVFHGFNKRSLQQALGMALGVHKHLLWGLTSVSSGVKLEGRRAGKDTQDEAP